VPLPAILAASVGRGLIAGLGPGGLSLPGFGGGKRRTRRKRRRLTAGQLQELAMIKNTLGKTAAANALPYYLR